MGFTASTITALVRHLTDWTLTTIDELFRDAGIGLGQAAEQQRDSSQRRSLARDYISSLDLTDPGDERKLLAVFTEVLHSDSRGPSGLTACEPLISRLRRDGFHVDLDTLTVTGGQHALTATGLSALGDASAVREQLARLDSTVAADPRAAVSAAKDLVESTAKLVLRERGIEFGQSDKLPKLVAAAQRSLGLDPRALADEKALRSLLGSLIALTQGLAELRNDGGTGHGRESVPMWVQPRHARLAATSATAWCDFILETLADPTAPWTKAGGRDAERDLGSSKQPGADDPA